MATKRLAQKLGLIRKRSSSSLEDVNQKSKPNQFFSYLIIIDFESTCWKDGKSRYPPEIIEFPAVLLNTSSGEIEVEFHTYVQPQEHPILSGFCTELTGIKQSQVEAGVPLAICLSQFSRWICRIQQEKGIAFIKDTSPSCAKELRPCAFVTWSDWDLGVCLHYECKRKQLRKADVLNSWIDLRATYKSFYNRKPHGLNGALQDVGIVFSGREHSGLDDARNTARLAWRMINDGCKMRVTKSLDRVPLMKNRVLGLPANGQPEDRPNLGGGDHSASGGLVPTASARRTGPAEGRAAGQSGHAEGGKSICTKSSGLCANGACHSLLSLKTQLNTLPAPLSHGKAGKDCSMMSRGVQPGAAVLVPTLALTSGISLAGGWAGTAKRKGSRLSPLRPCKKPPFTVHTDCSNAATRAPPSARAPPLTRPPARAPPLARLPACAPPPGCAPPLAPLPPGGWKLTPPLCGCGRRARRLRVSAPGLNHGEAFYSCPRGKQDAENGRGCGYFKWERALKREISVLTTHSSPDPRLLSQCR
eukprot:gi/632979333/ref/XP_007906410.1/ PREDICTED: ERI1 exoribonuclease 2 [Callorhinchus milii]